MKVEEELREAERTGEVVLGSNETLKATDSDNASLTVISNSAPFDVEEKLEKYSEENDIPIYRFAGGSKDLGLALGEPFSVSVLAVLDPGKSNVLEFGGLESGV